MNLGGLHVDATPALERFISRRERLLVRFDAVRASLDVWIGEHRDIGIPIAECAYFEGLLGERRSVLEALINIDDELLNHVLQLQNGMDTPRGPGGG
jgi:hypothetical protein